MRPMRPIKHSFMGVTDGEKIQEAVDIMQRSLRRSVLRAVLKGHCNATVYATAVPQSYKYPRKCEVVHWRWGKPLLEIRTLWPNQSQVVLNDGEYRRKIIGVQLRRLCRRLGLTPPAVWPEGLLFGIRRIKIGKRSAKVVTNDYRKARTISVPYNGNANIAKMLAIGDETTACALN